MKTAIRAGVMVTAIVWSIALARCTGGQEGTASEEFVEPTQVTQVARGNPFEVLAAINPAIPVYKGAEYRPDLTRRDETMFKTQYGPGTEVYTLATNDSFPQVWHYYVTYLAQYRAFDPLAPYPPENQNWRTIEIPLNQVMQDPFVPGTALARGGRRVVLQVAETEAEPPTVIRYVITPAPPAPPAVAANPAASAPAARQ